MIITWNTFCIALVIIYVFIFIMYLARFYSHNDPVNDDDEEDEYYG